MSKYTTEVRFICEQLSGLKDSPGYTEVGNIINSAIPKLFNFTFPIFDEAYRNVLCTKILKHYYTREICEETFGLWKLRLETRLNEIMPYYNQLYKSELLTFNPLYDTSITTENNATKKETTEKTENDVVSKGTATESTKNTSDNSTSTTSVTGKAVNNGTTNDENVSRDLYSDTPQGSLQNVENETYLTNARKISANNNETRSDTSDTSSNGTTTYTDTLSEKSNSETSDYTTADRSGNTELNSTDAYIQTVVGKSGGQSYSKMLEEFRKTFLNIDMRVIDDLSDLFFGLW